MARESGTTAGLGARSHPGFATNFLENSLPLWGPPMIKEGQAGQEGLLGPSQG